MKLIALSLFFFIAISFVGKGQTSVSVDLNFGKKKIQLKKNYSLNDSIQIQFSTIRFYMMNVVIYSNGIEHKMIESAKLIDAELDNNLVFMDEIASIDSISFLLGTDYKTNTSGVLEGDLDPINGMYWAWNSGYINVKFEGEFVNKKQENSFEYHLGGYAEPNTTAREIVLVPNSHSKKSISIDFSPFFLIGDDFTKQTILIPGKEAAEMMDKLSLSLNE